MKTKTLRRGVTGHLIQATQITELKPREAIASITVNSKIFSISTMVVTVTLTLVFPKGLIYLDSFTTTLHDH